MRKPLSASFTWNPHSYIPASSTPQTPVSATLKSKPSPISLYQLKNSTPSTLILHLRCPFLPQTCNLSCCKYNSLSRAALTPKSPPNTCLDLPPTNHVQISVTVRFSQAPWCSWLNLPTPCHIPVHTPPIYHPYSLDFNYSHSSPSHSNCISHSVSTVIDSKSDTHLPQFKSNLKSWLGLHLNFYPPPTFLHWKTLGWFVIHQSRPKPSLSK